MSEPAPDETATLCEQMAAIRHKRRRAGALAESMVKAEVAADIRRFVAQRPWIVVSVAATAGFLLAVVLRAVGKTSDLQGQSVAHATATPTTLHQADPTTTANAADTAPRGTDGHPLLAGAAGFVLPLALSLGKHLLTQWLFSPTPKTNSNANANANTNANANSNSNA